jgi:hypothetical protein
MTLLNATSRRLAYPSADITRTDKHAASPSPMGSWQEGPPPMPAVQIAPEREIGGQVRHPGATRT